MSRLNWRRPHYRLSLEQLERRNLPATFVLNEVKVNPPGFDERYEYIELKGTPGADLRYIYAIALEGDAPSCGLADLVVDLSSQHMGDNGLLMISAIDGAYLPAAETTLIEDGRFSNLGGVLENSSVSFALVYSPHQPILSGTDLDLNDDGTLELPAGAILLDAVGWRDGSSNSDRVYGAVLSQSTGFADAATRFRHSSEATSASAWFNADLTGESPASLVYDSSRASFNFPAGAILTPGGHNFESSPSNAPPASRDRWFTTAIDQTLEVSEALGLLENPQDLDADGDVLGIVNVDASNLPPGHALNVQPDGRVFYVPSGGFEGQVSFTYRVTDGSATSAAATVTIDVRNPNTAPQIAASDLPLRFVENGTPAMIVPDATLSDPDGDSFEGGFIAVTIAAGLDAPGDRLGIRADDSLRVIESFVFYQGAWVGTIDSAENGLNGKPLHIHFGSGANLAAVQALIRGFTFETLGDAPSTLDRSIGLEMVDGPEPDGATSEVLTRTIKVVAVNDRPSLVLGRGPSYRENKPPVAIVPSAAVGDADDIHFGGGSLVVAKGTGTESSDELSILEIGAVSLEGTQVLYEGTSLGNFHGGYASNEPLVVHLNEGATIAATQALVRAIGFRSRSENPKEGVHAVTFVLNDGERSSLVRTRSVYVVPINDKPIIVGSGGTTRYVRSTSPVTLLAAAEVVEDQPHFGGGRLTAANIGAHSNDRLVVRGNFTVEQGTNKLFLGSPVDGTHIGTLNTGGGIGATDLVIAFNANATTEIVQQILRSIRFRTAGSHSSLIGERTIEFTLTDSLGLAGNTAWRRVRVV